MRGDILAVPDPEARLANRTADQPLRVLVIGGSLGARRLNQVVPAALAMLDAKARPKVRHQCGGRHLHECESIYANTGVEAEIIEFIDDMPWNK